MESLAWLLPRFLVVICLVSGSLYTLQGQDPVCLCGPSTGRAHSRCSINAHVSTN